MLDVLNLTRRDALAMGEGFKAAIAVVGETASSESAIANKAASVAYLLKDCFKPWDKDENIESAGVVRVFDDVLYASMSAIQANGDPNWNPFATRGVLWKAIPNPNEDGSRENPITWQLGMELVVGWYYIENGVLYYCKRTETNYAFQHHLADLVSAGYVEVAE